MRRPRPRSGPSSAPSAWWAGWVDSRWTVAVAAAAAFLLRLPGLTRPVRADEAGYQLVARAWNPMPDSVYGAYFVDRPPPMIALFKFSDAIGGPLFIRVLGAVACAALVLAAAAVARLVADEHAARWTAVAVAALSTNVLIDAVAVKGELLALPVLMSSLGLSLVAVRDRSWRTALAAGLLAGLALGFKQNLAGGVVFAAVLFVGSWRAGRLTRTELVRLAGAASAGLRGAGARHGRLGAGGRRTPAHAVVRRLRLPLRRQPGALGRRRHRPDLPGRAARPGGPRCRDAADHRRLRGAHPRRVGRRRTADRCGGGVCSSSTWSVSGWAAASGATTCSRCCPRPRSVRRCWPGGPVAEAGRCAR